MLPRLFPASLIALVALSTSVAAAASPQDTFKVVYASAQTAIARAGALKNQWTTTEAALAAAKKEADAGFYEKAIGLAKLAEELAKASIAQSESEIKLWKDSELR